MKQTIKYLHDGYSEAEIEIIFLPYKKGKYRLEIMISDATDYGRLVEMIKWAFKKNEMG